MKNFISYTFVYLSLVFFVNLLITEQNSNVLFLLLTALGLFYNLSLIFFGKILPSDFKFLSAGFIGVLSAFIIFNGGIIQLMYIKNFDYIDANAFGLYLDYPTLIKFTNVAALGNVFLWFGYSLSLGDKLFAFYYEGLGYKRILHLNICLLYTSDAADE